MTTCLSRSGRQSPARGPRPVASPRPRTSSGRLRSQVGSGNCQAPVSWPRHGLLPIRTSLTRAKNKRWDNASLPVLADEYPMTLERG